MGEEYWLASGGSWTSKATFEPEVSVYLTGLSSPVYQTILHHHNSLPQGLLSPYQKEDRRQIQIWGSTLLCITMPNRAYTPTLIICQPPSPGHFIISLESTAMIFLWVTKYASECLFLKISLYSFKWHSHKAPRWPVLHIPSGSQSSLLWMQLPHGLLIIMFDTCWVLIVCQALFWVLHVD